MCAGLPPGVLYSIMSGRLAKWFHWSVSSAMQRHRLTPTNPRKHLDRLSKESIADPRSEVTISSIFSRRPCTDKVPAPS